MRRGAPRGATRHAREARRRPQPRHTDRCQAATAARCRKPRERAKHATNHGTRTGAKQHQLLSKGTCARPAANPRNSHRPDERVSAPQRRSTHATHSTTQRASTPVNRSRVAQDTAQHTGRAHRRKRAKEPRKPHRQHSTPSGHTGEQEPSGAGHRTRNTTHRAGTPVNRSQVAGDTAQAKQRTKRAHR